MLHIRLDTLKDAKRLSEIASGISDEHVTLTDNHGMLVNAKSILGVLGVLKYSDLWLNTSHYTVFRDFVVVE